MAAQYPRALHNVSFEFTSLPFYITIYFKLQKQIMQLWVNEHEQSQTYINTRYVQYMGYVESIDTLFFGVYEYMQIDCTHIDNKLHINWYLCYLSTYFFPYHYMYINIIHKGWSKNNVQNCVFDISWPTGYKSWFFLHKIYHIIM